MTSTIAQADHHNPVSLRLSEQGACPACRSRALLPVLSVQNVPTNSCLMLDTAEEARAFPRGDIALMFCESCGFVHNSSFDPLLTEYSERYEPTQAYSPTFNAFHKDLAARVVARFGLRGKTVVEVGCGQGEFLHLLCRLGGNKGIGFDPCLDRRREDVVSERSADVRLVGQFFSEAVLDGLVTDLLLSKMTLEHIPAADHFASLVATVARNSPPGMSTFIQVPDGERVFQDCAFWDVYYEHCSYFTEASLKGLFARHGFRTDHVMREYDGQYLAIAAHYAGGAEATADATEIARLRSLVDRFSADYERTAGKWRDVVGERLDRGERVVIWGSGSKGVSFLGAIGERASGISHVVDINPHRQGKYMVGTGHPIVAPATLKELRPATVIILNPVYEREIAAMLDDMQLHPEIMTL